MSKSDPQPTITLWTRLHAGLMVVATLAYAWVEKDWIVPGAGALSFAAYFLLLQRHWTQLGPFAGPANAITLARLMMILALVPQAAMWTKLELAGLALGSLVLDGVDGFIARRFNAASLFGEYLDKETDAFYGLIMCLVLHLLGQVGLWVLIPGGFRYLYVLAMIPMKPRPQKEPRFRFGQIIAVVFMGGLIVALLVPPLWATWLMVALSGLLLFSFGRSFIYQFRPVGEASNDE